MNIYSIHMFKVYTYLTYVYIITSVTSSDLIYNTLRGRGPGDIKTSFDLSINSTLNEFIITNNDTKHNQSLRGAVNGEERQLQNDVELPCPQVSMKRRMAGCCETTAICLLILIPK